MEFCGRNVKTRNRGYQCLRRSVWALAMILVSHATLAINISKLDRNDVVYKTHWIAGVLSTRKVRVVRINRITNRVKIRDLKTGEVSWINPGRLYTHGQLRLKQIKTGIKLAGEIVKASVAAIRIGCQKDGPIRRSEPSALHRARFCGCMARSIVRRENPLKIWDIVSNFAYVNYKYLGGSLLTFHYANCARYGTANLKVAIAVVYLDHAKRYRKPAYNSTGVNLTLDAARQGNVKAQFMAGLIYRDGLGVKKNVDTYLYWMRKSAAGGFAPARKILIYDPRHYLSKRSAGSSTEASRSQSFPVFSRRSTPGQKDSVANQFYDLLFYTNRSRRVRLRQTAFMLGVSQRGQVEQYLKRYRKPIKISQSLSYEKRKYYLQAYYKNFFTVFNFGHKTRPRWKNRLYKAAFTVEIPTRKPDKDRDLKKQTSRLLRYLARLYGKPRIIKFQYSSKRFSDIDQYVWKATQHVITFRSLISTFRSSGPGAKGNSPKIVLVVEYWDRSFYDTHASYEW